MPTLRILYDADGWAYHGNARGLQAHAPPDFEVSLASLDGREVDEVLGDAPPDVVLLLPSRRAPSVRAALSRRGWSTRLVTTVSAGWPSSLGAFLSAYEASDAVTLANHEYWDRTGRLPGTWAVPYGVDPDVFRITVPIARRPRRVLWVGSLFHRGLKAYDDRVLPLRDRLLARGIECELLAVDSRGGDRRSPAEMVEWYNTGAAYVCASRAEGTPNTLLEAAACGCAVVSTRVGNASELIRDGDNGCLVDGDVEVLLRGVETALARHVSLATRMQADIRAWHWSARAPLFYEVFRSVMAGHRPPGTVPRLDLSGIVTVVAASTPGALGAARRELLAEQDAAVTLRVVPPGQETRALREASTPYVVRVDATVLLYRDAVRRLWDALGRAGPGAAGVTGPLLDTHLLRPSGRVALVRRETLTDAANHHPATDDLRPESPGTEPAPLGLVGLGCTRSELYRSYSAESSRRDSCPDPWPAVAPETLLRRVLEERSGDDLAALMGMLAGALRRRGTPDADPRGAEEAAAWAFLEALGR